MTDDATPDWLPLEKVIVRGCDVLCGLACLSLISYAFTGHAVWRELEPDEVGRVVALIMLFAGALFAPLGGRLVLLSFRGPWLPWQKVIVRCCDVLCWLAILSLAAYAFTGYAVWGELEPDEFSRLVPLFMLFTAALFAPFGSRQVLLASSGPY